jgi:hypothetical protein
MNDKLNSLFGIPLGMQTLASRWKTWKARKTPLGASEPPLRAEWFSGEQLQRHAVALAGQHQLDPQHGPNRLLLRLADNERILIQACELVVGAEAEGRPGAGGKKDETDIDADRFFRAVDQAILQHHSRPSDLPLLLAALSEHHGIFHQISKKPFLLSQGIKIHSDALPLD